jgi:enoyl-CoA hydratase
VTQAPTTVRYTASDGVATIRLARDHGNAINETLAQDLMTTFHEADADPDVRGVLLTADGKLFCPGLDLRELVELDRAAMERFMLRFGAMLLALYTFRKPVVAALSGHALAGGCVLSLIADRRILVEGALVGLNEVIVGVPLPFGVSLMLRETVRTPILEEVALLGRNYRGQEAVDAGLVHEIHEAEGFEPFCLERLAQFTEKDPNAFATTKRYLRSAAVERIRANDQKFVPGFLDCWFSNDTQARICGIVEQLAASQQGATNTE